MPRERAENARALLLRFHSLGDVVLITGVARALAEETGAAIDIGTETRFRSLFAGLPWIDRVWSREELDGGPRPGHVAYDFVLDLQGTAGSHRLARRFGPTRSFPRYGLERRWVALWGDRFPRPAIVMVKDARRP